MKGDDGEGKRRPEGRQQPGPDNGWLREHAALLTDSFARWTGRSLLPADQDDARALFEAPFVVVSHDTAPDPVFNYANRRALSLFEMPWTQFVSTPSRYSAEPLHRDARAELMARVSRQGYIDDYQGVRITAGGRRFLIRAATVWNLVDDGGGYRGQAASFGFWEWLD